MVRIKRQVREMLLRERSDRRPKVRSLDNSAGILSELAGWVARDARRNPGDIARGAVVAAMDIINEIGGEASDFARDAVTGVIQGTTEISRSTKPIIRDVVAGAILGTSQTGGDVGTASEKAVEGAIKSAVSMGMTTEVAVAEATEGALKAITEIEGDVGGAARAAIVGVITGVSLIGGDVPKASRDAAHALIISTTIDSDDVAHVARSAIEGALEVRNENPSITTNTVYSVAVGTIDGAYGMSSVYGDAARLAILNTVERPGTLVDPRVEPSLDDIAKRVSRYLPKAHGTWRGRAIWRAARSLIDIGGVDLAASLAFFTLLSFFPLVALIIIAFASFADPDFLRQSISDIFLYFFPASGEFFNSAIEHLFHARLAAGLIAVAGILIGANGLFMAANRAVNRVFGCRPRRIVGTTLLQVAIAFGVMLLFLVSIGLTFVFQLILGVSAALPLVGGPVSRLTVIVTGIASAVLPIFITALVFAVVYRYVPNLRVRWSDSTFGAIVVVILFEVFKHVFFWFGNLVGQRSLLYAPFSSVVILLVWAYLAGLIFLYGASLVKEAAELRPNGLRRSSGKLNA